MDELIKMVSEDAGISESQAKKAVETVAGYLKDQLPAPFDAQVESVLKDGVSSGSIDSLTKGLGGMFGKN